MTAWNKNVLSLPDTVVSTDLRDKSETVLAQILVFPELFCYADLRLSHSLKVVCIVLVKCRNPALPKNKDKKKKDIAQYDIN